MSTENNLVFDESQFKIKSRRIIGAPEVPGMIKVLVRNRLVKTEKQAIIILLGVIIIFLTSAVFLMKKAVSVPTATISPELTNNNN